MNFRYLGLIIICALLGVSLSQAQQSSGPGQPAQTGQQSGGQTSSPNPNATGQSGGGSSNPQAGPTSGQGHRGAQQGAPAQAIAAFDARIAANKRTHRVPSPTSNL